MSALFGAGYVGLRALATGLPAGFLLNPRRALAAVGSGAACAERARRSSSSSPRRATAIRSTPTCPGTYDDPSDRASGRSVDGGDQADARRARRYTAAAPWATLPQSVLDRTTLLSPHDQHAGASQGARRAQADGRDLSVGDAAVDPGQAAGAVPRHRAGAADHHRRDVAVARGWSTAGRRCRSFRRCRSRTRWRRRRGR